MKHESHHHQWALILYYRFLILGQINAIDLQIISQSDNLQYLWGRIWCIELFTARVQFKRWKFCLHMKHHLYKKKSSAHEKSISFSLNKNHSIVALYVPIYFSKKKKTSRTKNTEIEKNEQTEESKIYSLKVNRSISFTTDATSSLYFRKVYTYAFCIPFLSFFWSTNSIRRIAFDSWTACILSFSCSLLFYHPTSDIVSAPLFHCSISIPCSCRREIQIHNRRVYRSLSLYGSTAHCTKYDQNYSQFTLEM